MLLLCKTKFMKSRYFFLLAFVAFLASSCARHIQVRYQAQKANTSDIVLKYNKISRRTKVIINDILIVDGRQAKSVTIMNVPVGEYKIRCSSSSGLKKDRLYVTMGIKSDGLGKVITREIEMPLQNGWYWVGVSSLAVWPLVLIAGYTL